MCKHVIFDNLTYHSVLTKEIQYEIDREFTSHVTDATLLLQVNTDKEYGEDLKNTQNEVKQVEDVIRNPYIVGNQGPHETENVGNNNITNVPL